jgi:hypothetical protein
MQFQVEAPVICKPTPGELVNSRPQSGDLCNRELRAGYAEDSVNESAAAGIQNLQFVDVDRSPVTPNARQECTYPGVP